MSAAASGTRRGFWAAAAQRFVYPSSLYAMTLRAGPDADFAVFPARAAHGDAMTGRLIVQHPAAARGGAESWAQAGGGGHRFEALAHLAALGDAEAARTARVLIDDWITTHPSWTPMAWEAGAIGRRLRNWIAYAPFYAPGRPAPPDRRADGESAPRTTFRADVAASTARQARHLARCGDLDPTDLAAFDAASGLIWAAAALPALDDFARRGFERLCRCADAQIAPDGGHYSRRPQAALAALVALVDARAAGTAIGFDTPEPVNNAIDRLAPLIQAWRHGDGGFALLAGGDAADGAAIDAALAAVDHTGRPAKQASHTGFQRLDARVATVVIDAGAPGPDWDEGAHAAALAFEFSVNGERLIVSCGAPDGAPEEWREIARGTAAHSALVIADTNSAEIIDGGGLGRRPRVAARRGEDHDGFWIEAGHDGWRERFGALYRRRLTLARDGRGLSGEDVIQCDGAAPFAIRFHLHPDVRATLIRDGQAALLAPASGGGWRFTADDADIAIEDSVYWGDGAPRKAVQIVLSGAAIEGAAHVRWRFLREARRA